MNDQERLLTIFLRLQAGAHLRKKELADEFAVSEKTIQRDLALLRDFLASQLHIASELVYSRKTNSYAFQGKAIFNKKDILVIAKILLENRALNQEENEDLLRNLLSLVSREEQKEIEQIIGSEKLNYVPLSDQQNRVDKIWDLSEAIRRENVMDISYQSPYTQTSKEQTILPVSLYYDSHYFYVVAYQLKHETYITLRVDRILSWKWSNQPKPIIPYRDKFRDGDIRNQRVDAFMSKKVKLELEFLYDPTIVLDQFPTAKIVGENGEWTRFKLESQHTPGLKRWLLGQGEAVKVLSPQVLVDDLKETIREMMEQYK
ncbi:putative transcriptional regulator [Streptococcus sp. DD10]|uniref:helix-turn-helix transcriptional regulator n=1 Tax=Streptococcus sp. DD10 TaxID=1777878 RepID=UPI000791A00E|nr:WYL domain-containing protein [Streptococcus sp. DD10]KXT72326.1 putative transcriptional regulator [Streptococcus sp. DD10]